MNTTQQTNLARHIRPAMGGLCATYLYNVVDGIFVGQGVGSAALGAVNLGVPFLTFVVALAAMFPMGGATVVAIRMGRGDDDGANRAFLAALLLTLAASTALMAAGMLFARPIVLASGGAALSPGMQRMAADYLFYYSAFSIPMLLSTCLSVFVRNDGSPGLSFAGMGIGAAANIFLDWLFIFPLDMGVVGAAVASGLGQVASVAVLLSHFVRKRGRLRLCPRPIPPALLGKVCKRGVPEAVSQLNTPVTALCYNLVLSHFLGDMGVSTFSVLSFLSSLAGAVLSGVAQGLQPLWGQSYGRGDAGALRRLLGRGLGINLGAAALMYALLLPFGRGAVALFSQDPVLIQAACQALPLFSLSFLPMALNLVCTAFLFSTKRTARADAVALCRGAVVKAACIFALPAWFGPGLVWAAPLASELLTLLPAVLLLHPARSMEA